MSESDSCIPQKVAALVDALEAVRRHLGYEGELGMSFRRWLDANVPIGLPLDTYPKDAASKEVFAAAAKFVEAVNTAERMLNAFPASVLKPLSALIDGVPWDMRTRRTLKAIQDAIILLSQLSQHPNIVLVLLSGKTKVGFDEMQSKLIKFRLELNERILDLKSLPDYLTDPTDAINREQRDRVKSAHKGKETNHSTEQAEADLRQLEATERNTPALDIRSVEWIAARKKNQKKLGYPTSTLATYRLRSGGGRQLSSYFGIDKDGRRWRRQSDKTEKSTVYYFADDVKKYQPKASN